MTRQMLLIGVVLLLAVGLAIGYWFVSREPVQLPAGPPHERPTPPTKRAVPQPTPTPPAMPNTMTIAPERLQTSSIA